MNNICKKCGSISNSLAINANRMVAITMVRYVCVKCNKPIDIDDNKKLN